MTHRSGDARVRGRVSIHSLGVPGAAIQHPVSGSILCPQGDFETLFRPKEQNFDDVLISEERGVNLPSWSSYHYIFRNPQGRKVRDSWGRETFFMRYHNILFVIWQENALAPITEAVQDER